MAWIPCEGPARGRVTPRPSSISPSSSPLRTPGLKPQDLHSFARQLEPKSATQVQSKASLCALVRAQTASSTPLAHSSARLALTHVSSIRLTPPKPSAEPQDSLLAAKNSPRWTHGQENKNIYIYITIHVYIFLARFSLPRDALSLPWQADDFQRTFLSSMGSVPCCLKTSKEEPHI